MTSGQIAGFAARTRWRTAARRDGVAMSPSL